MKKLEVQSLLQFFQRLNTTV